MKKNEYIAENKERTTGGLAPAMSALMPLAKKILGKKGFVEADILMNWPQIVGTELAEFAQAEKISFPKGERSNGVLFLTVFGGAFALEIQHNERNILQKINAYFGYRAVNSLKIMQKNLMDLKNLKEDVESKQKNLVTPQEEFYIKDLSSGVKNPALQEVLERLGRHVIGENKEEN